MTHVSSSSRLVVPIPRGRGFSDSRFASPLATGPPPRLHKATSWRGYEDNSPHRPYPAVLDTEEEYYTKRRRTMDRGLYEIEADVNRNRSCSDAAGRMYHHEPAPISQSIPSYDRHDSAQSWRWTYFPDQAPPPPPTLQHRHSMQKLPDTSRTTPSSSSAVLPGTGKQPGRHQRKRSAGCLNCHTIWSPTWRKDSQGLMRCNACGLYLAARGQERPLTLVPKRKNNEDGSQSKPPSPSSQEPPLQQYSPTGSKRRASEDDGTFPFPPYYPSSERGTSMKPSPSYSHRSLGTPSSGSSCLSMPTANGDLLSPANVQSNASSPTSPLFFSKLTLDHRNSSYADRYPPRLSIITPYSGHDNMLGLHNITSRDPITDRFSREEHVEVIRLPSPGPLSATIGSTSNYEGKSPRLTLPPLSELTKGISSWKSGQDQWQRKPSIAHDRQQTELLDMGLARGERMMSM